MFLFITQLGIVTAQDNNSNSVGDTVDFEFAFCYSPEVIVLPSQDILGTDYKDYVLDINISSLINSQLRIEYNFAKNVEILDSQNNYSLSLKANQIQLELAINESLYESKVVYGSIEGEYRLNNVSQSGSWKSFSLYDCYPYYLKLFDSGNDVHNMTIQLNITDLNGGNLTIHYFTGVWDGVRINQFLIEEIGISEHTEKAHEISMTFFGENNSYIKGTYQLIDQGFLYAETGGFLFELTIAVPILIFIVKKKNRKKNI